MQTPAEEYSAEEACHIVSPLGRTFNLLSRGTAALQVAQLKDTHLPASFFHFLLFALTLRTHLRGHRVFDLNGTTLTAHGKCLAAISASFQLADSRQGTWGEHLKFAL